MLKKLLKNNRKKIKRNHRGDSPLAMLMNTTTPSMMGGEGHVVGSQSHR